MEIYTKDDELPDDIANDGDELVPISDLPAEHLAQLVDWGVDVHEAHVRERDGTA